MNATATNGAMPDAGKAAEKLPPFRATPEAISQYLELKTDEVVTQMKSVQGRQELFRKLMKHEDALKKIRDFHPEELRHQLDIAGEAIVAKEKFMKDTKSPEKKGMFQRAWEKVKSFPRRHPVVTALLIVAAAAAGMYVLWNYMGNVIPVPDAMKGAASVAKEGIPPVSPAFHAPPTSIVPPNLTVPPYANPVGGAPEIFAPPPAGGVHIPADLYPHGFR